MLARTFMQPASVTSFGLKCVNWAAPLVRSLQRLPQSEREAIARQAADLKKAASGVNSPG